MDLKIKGTVFKTQTEDGYELDAVLVEPEAKAKRIIIHFHGKEGDFLTNHFIWNMADNCKKSGIAFMTVSHRGRSFMSELLRKSASGFEYTQMGSAFDIFEDCIYDIEAWVRVARSLDYKEIILQQHSMPQKILWYTNKVNPRNVVSLILISPSDIAFLFEKYVLDYENNLELALELVKNKRGSELMPVNLWNNCPVSASTFANWGKKDSHTQVFNYLHPEKGFGYFGKVKLPMLAILADNDFSVGTPANTCLKMLKEKSTSTRFKTKLIVNANHGYQGKENALSKVIVNWVQKL